MKLVVYKVNNKKSKGIKSKSILFERILFISCIAVFAILVGVQGLMMNPSTSAYITVNSELDGTPLGAEEILYKQGQIELCMADDRTDENVKVLLNGEEVACFSESVLTIRVKDGDVVELDCSEAESENIVYVKSKSENIKNIDMNKKMKTKTGIIEVGKVKIE